MLLQFAIHYRNYKGKDKNNKNFFFWFPLGITVSLRNILDNSSVARSFCIFSRHQLLVLLHHHHLFSSSVLLLPGVWQPASLAAHASLHMHAQKEKKDEKFLVLLKKKFFPNYASECCCTSINYERNKLRKHVAQAIQDMMEKLFRILWISPL